MEDCDKYLRSTFTVVCQLTLAAVSKDVSCLFFLKFAPVCRDFAAGFMKEKLRGHLSCRLTT